MWRLVGPALLLAAAAAALAAAPLPAAAQQLPNAPDRAAVDSPTAAAQQQPGQHASGGSPWIEAGARPSTRRLMQPDELPSSARGPAPTHPPAAKLGADNGSTGEQQLKAQQQIAPPLTLPGPEQHIVGGMPSLGTPTWITAGGGSPAAEPQSSTGLRRPLAAAPLAESSLVAAPPAAEQAGGALFEAPPSAAAAAPPAAEAAGLGLEPLPLEAPFAAMPPAQPAAPPSVGTAGSTAASNETALLAEAAAALGTPAASEGAAAAPSLGAAPTAAPQLQRSNFSSLISLLAPPASFQMPQLTPQQQENLPKLKQLRQGIGTVSVQRDVGNFGGTKMACGMGYLSGGWGRSPAAAAGALVQAAARGCSGVSRPAPQLQVARLPKRCQPSTAFPARSRRLL